MDSMGFNTSSRDRLHKFYQKIKGKSELIWMYYYQIKYFYK